MVCQRPQHQGAIFDYGVLGRKRKEEQPQSFQYSYNGDVLHDEIQNGSNEVTRMKHFTGT